MTEIRNLAILGAKPVFDRPVHVGRPNIGDRQRLMERINDMLDRDWLTNNGPYVREFEEKILDMTGAQHCVAVCNATVGLEILIRAAELTGEVIIPSNTFIATAHALQWQQITPVFCDIDPATHNIDPARIESLITPRTSGIIGVHVWGRACSVDRLADIARRHNLKLLFDAAHAFGCSHEGRMIGTFGLAEVFSFHATKFLNSFEGGAIVTNNEALAKKIQLMKNFGFAGYDNVIYIGTNGKMTEVCAAMGLVGLESMEAFINTNRQNYLRYKDCLSAIPGITMVEYDESERNNYQYVVIEVNDRVTGIGRDQIVKVLHSENILARRYFFPGCHQMEPYRSYFPHSGLLLSETESMTKRVIVLPTGSSVSTSDVSLICEVIRTAIEQREAVKGQLKKSG